jgi:hypothetical protein
MLRTHSGVREPVTVVRDRGEKQLVAHVVAAESAGAGGASNPEVHAPLKRKESLCRESDYLCDESARF